MMNPELESEERRKKTRYIGRHLAITFLLCLLLILLPYLFLQILKHRPYWWLAENKSFIEMEQICVEKIGDKYNGFYAEPGTAYYSVQITWKNPANEPGMVPYVDMGSVSGNKEEPSMQCQVFDYRGKETGGVIVPPGETYEDVRIVQIGERADHLLLEQGEKWLGYSRNKYKITLPDKTGVKSLLYQEQQETEL